MVEANDMGFYPLGSGGNRIHCERLKPSANIECLAPICFDAFTADLRLFTSRHLFHCFGISQF